MKGEGEVSLKPVTDFFALQGSIKSNKPFDIEAMDKSVKGTSKRIMKINSIIRVEP